ncbi:MAG: FtsX-like permease family protein [Actinobacteria bacterium]|nr:FtsX-like permease family protein [Actinomycetota bacterium]
MAVVLIAAGVAFATALISASLIVGDSVKASIRAVAYEHLGAVDELVETTDQAQWNAATRLLSELDESSAEIDGVVAFRTIPVALRHDGRVLADARIIVVDAERADRFESGQGLPTKQWATLGTDGRLVTSDVANRLNIVVGDDIEVWLGGQWLSDTVDGIAPRAGLSGFDLGLGSASYNVIAPASNVPTDAAIPGTVYYIGISQPGGVTHSKALPASPAGAALAGTGLSVQPVKDNVLRIANVQSAELGSLFAALGLFGIVAGLLLTINIVTMLTQYRRRELGTLKALGLRPADIGAVLGYEAALVSIVGAVIGTIGGIGLALLVVRGLADIVGSGGVVGEPFDLQFGVRWVSLLWAAVAGIGLSGAVTLVWMRRQRSMSAVSAMASEDLDGLSLSHTGQAPLRTAKIGLVLAIVGVTVSIWSAIASNTVALVVGPPLICAGLGAVFVTRYGRRAFGWAGGGMLFWTMAAMVMAPGDLAELGVVAFAVLGVLASASATILVVGFWPDRLTGRFGGWSWRLAATWPGEQRVRVGLIVASFAMVMFVLIFATVMTSSFTGQRHSFVEDAAGGASVRLSAAPGQPIAADSIAADPAVAVAAPVARLYADVYPADSDGVFWPVAVFGEEWAEVGPPALRDRGGAASDAELFKQVAQTPGLVIVDPYMGQQRAGLPEYQTKVGDRLTLVDVRTANATEVTVAGVTEDPFARLGVLMGGQTADAAFGTQPSADLSYVRWKPDLDDVEVAAFTDRMADLGLEVQSFEQIVGDAISTQVGLFRLFQAYLGLGLIAGMGGLGVVMARAAWERRRSLAIVRSMGATEKDLAWMLTYEGLLVSGIGVMLGLFLALFTVDRLLGATERFGPHLAMTWPVPTLAAITAATILGSYVACWPVRRWIKSRDWSGLMRPGG